MLVYSSGILENYKKKSHKLLRHFKKNLKLKLKKYYFHQKKIDFLKYIIGRNKISINL